MSYLYLTASSHWKQPSPSSAALQLQGWISGPVRHGHNGQMFGGVIRWFLLLPSDRKVLGEKCINDKSSLLLESSFKYVQSRRKRKRDTL